jgi:hypothetical protein
MTISYYRLAEITQSVKFFPSRASELLENFCRPVVGFGGFTKLRQDSPNLQPRNNSQQTVV